MKQVRLTLDGRAHDVRIETDPDGNKIVTIDGHAHQIGTVTSHVADPTRLVVPVDGVPHRVQRQDLFTAQIDETTSEFALDAVRSGLVGATVGAAGAAVYPPMPGRVVSIRAQAGDEVAAGQVLLVLEAMKMQNEVTSPAAGTVAEVRVQAGSTVDTRDILVVLGPPGATRGTEAPVVSR